MSNGRFFKRSYHLTFTDEVTGKSRTYTELDIKFNIKKMICQHKYEAKISILGLSFQTINEITATSIMSPIVARQLKKRVTLTAGYDGNETALFTGYIVHAVCGTPPEMWLHITADNYVEDVQEVYKFNSKKGIPLLTVFKNAAKTIGWQPVIWYTGENLPCSEFAFVGNKTNMVSSLNQLANWEVFNDGQFLYAVDKRVDKDSIGVVERKSGLIRVTNVDYVGASFQTWLRNDYPLARSVELKSELIPAANGKYRIYEKEYNGHYRGGEWFTIYHGIRQH